ncbi:hook-length control protein FliK [Nitrosomonas cryotolerans]|uniref:Hook-length control protein FliK n=1 Tax=Nitrosomonas cryotolerans ATCC 49181 TaxID=1131553 RepID=A0A1N6I6G9_9PROT|nr:flagellar hook-length control protein FliK [Nitrosomonas cryotolerans]SFP91329.1 hook-length control protein FliK [Nitrosomonas cryotolerans]SIO27525.1 hook-length control protein FliK [Nitrosomonas cryotolerans ATCC 49181]
MIPTIIKTDSISQPSPSDSVAPVTPVAAASNVKNALSHLIPGQKYQALIESRLPNNHVKVVIANQSLHMHLPENIRPGDQIELVFISREPRLQFLLQSKGLSDGLKHNASISTTGRFLSALTQGAIKPSIPQSSTLTTPILPSPPSNSQILPGLLQIALSQSGLFYESHQAQWIAGKKTLAQLQQEPQGKLTFTTIDMPTASHSIIPADIQSIYLVQQQLAALETGHITWRGEVWCEQAMEWDILEHKSDGKSDTDKFIPWQTQLRLTLPQLGDIIATIAFDAQREVHIKLDTTITETACLLKKNQSPLAAAMTSAGLKIQAVEVQHHVRE